MSTVYKSCDVIQQCIQFGSSPLQKCLAFNIRNRLAAHLCGLIAMKPMLFGSISKNLNHFISFICVLQSTNYNNGNGNNSMQYILAHFNIIRMPYAANVHCAMWNLDINVSPPSLSLCALRHLRHCELRKFPYLTYKYSISSHFKKCNCMECLSGIRCFLEKP